MNAPSIDIKDMLESYGDSSGIQGIDANTVFIGREPDKPNECITIFDYTGRPPYLGLTNVGYEYPSVQIRVRSLSYITGWALIEAIKTALHGRANETWNGTLYTVIYCSSGPALLDHDDHNRVRFIINFNLQRR